jgi:diguanylate cyclase (GGDEF)-like protein/PAS domain S-box-containing protein
MNLDYEQYRLILEYSPNMIWRSGIDTLCDYFNATWLNFTGRTIQQELGNGWAEGVHPEDFEACLKIYLESFAEQKSFEMEYRLKRKDGEWRWINDRGVPFYNNANEFVGYIGSCMDVTDRVEGHLLREQAQKDGLTGINNRQYFEQLARDEFEKAKRFKSNLCLVMIDVDKFKKINDIYGHQAGDLVLKQIAQTLSQNIRDFDILGRYGGDEFIMLMPNTSYAESMISINRIKETIESLRISYNKVDIKTSISFGIHQMVNEDSFEKLILESDKKLYQCKQNKL